MACSKNLTLSGGSRRGSKRSGSKRSGSKRQAKKTRKMSKGASSWTSKVTALYKQMKKSDPAVSFRDALVKASKLKKAGQL